MQEVSLFNMLTSIFTGLAGILSGWVLIPFIAYYQDYIKIKYEQKIRFYVIRRGYIAAYLSMVIGVFYLYHAYFIYSKKVDFNGEDWVVFHLLIGCYFTLIMNFFINIYGERRRIERLVADKNDERLAKFLE